MEEEAFVLNPGECVSAFVAGEAPGVEAGGVMRTPRAPAGLGEDLDTLQGRGRWELVQMLSTLSS